MRGLEVASKVVHNLFINKCNTPPSRIIISSDNMGTIQWIFQGSPGKAQSSLLTFCKHILELLDKHVDLHIALMWCPGHFDIEGNERADKLAKSGSHLIPKHPNYKSLLYLGSRNKHNIGKEWLHRWTNSHMTLRSKFHITNCIPPHTRPTDRFVRLDHCTFSRILQCHTGHAQIREYYKWFIPNEEQNCHCSETLQTWGHILLDCKNHSHHHHLLGTGKHWNIESLLGTERGIKRLAHFLNASRAYKKWPTVAVTNQ